MRALALDLAGRTGYVLGDLSERPKPAVLSVAVEKGTSDLAAARLGCWLRDIFSDPAKRPDIIVAERGMPAGGQKGGYASELQQKLHGALAAVAACYGIEVLKPAASTARKTFTGRGTYSSREEAKAASVRAAVFHGFMDKWDRDNDKADAAGLFFWLALEKGSRLKVLTEARELIPF